MVAGAGTSFAPFADRSDAGRRLAEALDRFRSRHPVVLALPRGGVPVALEVARRLDAPLDLALVRKIGAPGHPEYAIGAVAAGAEPLIVRHDDTIRALGIDDTAFAGILAREIGELERRRRAYLAGRHLVPVEGRAVIVVDDGIATGATVTAALRSVRARRPKWLVLAAPVAAAEALPALRAEADELVVLTAPEQLRSVGAFYAVFDEVSDAAVIQALAAAPGAR